MVWDYRIHTLKCAFGFLGVLNFDHKRSPKDFVCSVNYSLMATESSHLFLFLNV